MKTTPSLRSRTALLSTVFACAGALLLGACAVEADDPEELTGEDAAALSCTNPSRRMPYSAAPVIVFPTSFRPST